MVTLAQFQSQQGNPTQNLGTDLTAALIALLQAQENDKRNKVELDILRQQFQLNEQQARDASLRAEDERQASDLALGQTQIAGEQGFLRADRETQIREIQAITEQTRAALGNDRNALEISAQNRGFLFPGADTFIGTDLSNIEDRNAKEIRTADQKARVEDRDNRRRFIRESIRELGARAKRLQSIAKEDNRARDRAGLDLVPEEDLNRRVKNRLSDSVNKITAAAGPEFESEVFKLVLDQAESSPDSPFNLMVEDLVADPVLAKVQQDTIEERRVVAEEDKLGGLVQRLEKIHGVDLSDDFDGTFDDPRLQELFDAVRGGDPDLTPNQSKDILTLLDQGKDAFKVASTGGGGSGQFAGPNAEQTISGPGIEGSLRVPDIDRGLFTSAVEGARQFSIENLLSQLREEEGPGVPIRSSFDTLQQLRKTEAEDRARESFPPLDLPSETPTQLPGSFIDDTDQKLQSLAPAGGQVSTPGSASQQQSEALGGSAAHQEAFLAGAQAGQQELLQTIAQQLQNSAAPGGFPGIPPPQQQQIQPGVQAGLPQQQQQQSPQQQVDPRLLMLLPLLLQGGVGRSVP